MSQLVYMTKRGAGALKTGTAAKLGPELQRLRTSAELRSDHGAVIGSASPCDLSCDGQCDGWHWWYDADGDDVRPEPEADDGYAA